MIGLAIGLAVALNGFTYRTFHPLLLLIYAIPQVTILPLFVLYFGSGPPSKIAFGVSHGLFPIAINVIAGVQGIRPVLLASATLDGRRRWLIFQPHHAALSGAEPVHGHAARHQRHAARRDPGRALRLVRRHRPLHADVHRDLPARKLFALIAALALFAVLINETMRAFERRLSRWR